MMELTLQYQWISFYSSVYRCWMTVFSPLVWVFFASALFITLVMIHILNFIFFLTFLNLSSPVRVNLLFLSSIRFVFVSITKYGRWQPAPKRFPWKESTGEPGSGEVAFVSVRYATQYRARKCRQSLWQLFPCPPLQSPCSVLSRPPLHVPRPLAVGNSARHVLLTCTALYFVYYLVFHHGESKYSF